MEKKLENAVKVLAQKAADSNNAIDAVQYAQAALNAVNALISLKLN